MQKSFPEIFSSPHTFHFTPATMPELDSDWPDLPPYTYVPGFAPHPISDPNGHLRSFCPPQAWDRQQHVQWGQQLFEHGYYWESHEAWEHLWWELGRASDDALIVKGLIKLAACGVKCREGNAVGAARHAKRAAELLAAGSESSLFKGLNLQTALDTAQQAAQTPPVNFVAPSHQPVPLPGMCI